MRYYIHITIYFYLGIIIALTLWPYRFWIPTVPCQPCSNGAIWVSNDRQVGFENPGLGQSVSSPIDLHQRLVAANALTIEVWLTTATLNQTGPARILSYSEDQHSRNFTLGQENDDLVFRLRTSETDLNGRKSEITVPGVFLPHVRQQIVVIHADSLTRVYVDGKLRKEVPGPGGNFANWNRDYRLLIGNERTGNRPWLGSLYGIGLLDRPVSASEVAQSYRSGGLMSDRSGVVALFDFSEGGGNQIKDTSGLNPGIVIEFPQYFNYESDQEFFSPHGRYLADFVTNFVTFLPFGFLLSLGASNICRTTLKATVSTALIAVLLPLFTESVQYFVKDRTSSLYDFVSCVAGILAGCILAVASRRFIRLTQISDNIDLFRRRLRRVRTHNQ